ncbi:hypothetical protein C8R42DRAFT_726519 [Lentinula raphanica]|nr:hypothetical protein C8R42DRAFT_726519 [Lentinula raphanica]
MSSPRLSLVEVTIEHSSPSDARTGGPDSISVVLDVCSDTADAPMSSPRLTPLVVTTASSSSRPSQNGSTRVSRKHLHQFLDIEALEDYDDDDTQDLDSDVSEGQKDVSSSVQHMTVVLDDFIDDVLLGEASVSQSSTISFGLPRPRTPMNSFLEHLEATYVHGTKILLEETRTTEEIAHANPREQDWIETLLLESTHLPDDWVLFRADCKSGSEYQILFNVMESSIPQREVRSAFYNLSLGSHIYFEASVPNNRPSVLLNFLNVHSD